LIRRVITEIRRIVIRRKDADGFWAVNAGRRESNAVGIV
jgi:hypothetical protein